MSEEPTKDSEATEEKLEQAALSAEELKEFRDKQISFNEEQFPYLESQHKFTKLSCEIEEFKARRLRAIAVQTEFMKTPGVPEQEEEIGKDGFPVSWSKEEKQKYVEEAEADIKELKEAVESEKDTPSETKERTLKKAE